MIERVGVSHGGAPTPSEGSGMLELTLAKVQPFLPPLSAAQSERVEAWLPVLQLLLNRRYGDKITDAESVPEGQEATEPLFVSVAGDAIARRLTRPNGLIDQQAVGPASVRYNARANLAVWFLPEELAQLDDIAGFGRSVRSVRTPAPDGIRFGNMMPREVE